MLLLLAVPAWALDTDTFLLAGSSLDRHAGLQLESPVLGDAGAWYGGLSLAYAHDPVVEVFDDGTIEPYVGSSFATTLAGGYTIKQLLRLDVAVPLYPYVGAAGSDYSGGSVGDARIGALVPVVRRDAFDFGVKPSLVLPTGSPDHFTGSGGVGAGLVGAFEARPADKVFLAANAGFNLKPAADLGDFTFGSGLAVGAGAGYHVNEQMTVGAELDGVVELAGGLGMWNQNPFELHGYGTYAAPSGLVGTVGLGTGIVRGVGAPDVRAVLAIGYSKPGKPPIVDTDGDGLFDDKDACVNDPETVNNWKDDDGCPDSLGKVAIAVYRDGKPAPGADVAIQSGATELQRFGLVGPAELDAMPGSQWSARAEFGKCLAGEGSTTATEGRADLRIDLHPVLDANVDLEIVDEKGAPVPSATVTWEHHDDGCAPTEAFVVNDGKGTQAMGVGKHRVFINAPGFGPFVAAVELDPGEREVVHAVLKATKVRLEKTRIVILDKVFFETNKAIIKPESFGLLDQVANTLISNPDIQKVEVSGHTDSDGNDAFNLKLSQARAESVVAYLTAHGVDAARLSAMGYGETKPVDSNKTAKGKANNRRVEFNIVDTPAAAGANQ